MKFTAVVLVLTAVLAAAVAEMGDEELPHLHLRQETEPEPRSWSLRFLNFLEQPHNIMYRSSYERGGGKSLKDRGSSYCDKHDKCDECEGDCDSDSDCKSGLYCYKRGPHQSVPGCSGGSSNGSNSDFCVPKKYSHSASSKSKPKSQSKSKSKSSSSKDHDSDKIRDKGDNYCAKYGPCKECYGDCDDDHDCDKGLACYHRKPYQSVPGCSGGSKAKSKTDFCVKEKYVSHSKPSPSKSRSKYPSKSSSKSSDHGSDKIRDKGTNYCAEHGPCKECYGDCDDDHDCDDGLYCYHRKPYQSVPGCSGGSKAKSKTDFCVKKKYHK